MGVPSETEGGARALAERAWNAGESIGVHPAGCLEVACRDDGVEIMQFALAEAADVTPVTVRAHRDRIEAARSGWQ